MRYIYVIATIYLILYMARWLIAGIRGYRKQWDIDMLDIILPSLFIIILAAAGLLFIKNNF